MSNLGGYQNITTWSKKFGGPYKFLFAVASAGYVFFRMIEGGGRHAYKSLKEETTTNKTKINEYKVLRDAIDSQGLTFKVGDTIRILETANDVILIEKVGDNNNPYYVYYKFMNLI